MLEAGHLYGMRIITTNMITKDVKARKHRKKRIDKKWLKRYGYKAVPDNAKVYSANGILFMTKGFYQKIKKIVDNGGNAEDFIKFKKYYEELTRQ